MADHNDMHDFEQQTADQKKQTEQEFDPKSRDLLKLPEDKAGRKVIKLWHKQDDSMRHRFVRWKVNRLRRAGMVGVRIKKERDTKDAKVWAPLGPQIPSLNKAARLCRRMASTIFSDPAAPETVPATDSDDDREAAEVSRRVLLDLGSEGNLNDAMTARQAFDLASVYASGFRRYWVDPTAGGSRPMAVQVTADVVDVETARTNPGPGPHVTKYVLADGSLTDDENADGVQRQFLPKLKSEVLSGRNVRFLPPTAVDIWAASGAMVGAMVPYGDLRDQFPDIDDLDEEDSKRLRKGSDKDTKELLPPGHLHGNRDHESDEFTDDTLIFTVFLYYKKGGRHPKGAYIVAAGDGILLHRQPWTAPDGEELDIPIDQFKQFDWEQDPYGIALMQFLGEGNEIRGSQIGAFLDHLAKFSRRRIFLPTNSTIQPKQLQGSSGEVIQMNAGGQPVYEDLPDFPRAGEKMLEFVNADMDDESGLQQVGAEQGLAAPSVGSGLHAQRIIEQMLVGLSDLLQNTGRGITRGWRIQLQLVRAFFEAPQQASWMGDDGEYKLEQWQGSDLGSTKDVRIMRGSFTALSVSSKADVAATLLEMGGITQSQFKQMVMGGVGGSVGLEDDPHRMRIRRQLNRWAKGPPDDIQDEQQSAQAAQAIFDARPNEELPEIALVRLEEIARMMAGTKFAKWPPFWQQALVAELQRAQSASGIQTIAEQQQAQQAAEQAAQQAQQAQVDAEAQAEQAKLAIEQSKVEAGLQEAQISSQTQIQEAEIQAAAEIEPDVNINISIEESNIPEGVTSGR